MRVYRRYFKEQIEQIEVDDVKLLGEDVQEQSFLNEIVNIISDLDLILTIPKEDNEVDHQNTDQTV